MMGFAMGLDAAVALFKRYKGLILITPLLLLLAVQSCQLSSTKKKLTQAQTLIAQLEMASEQAEAMQIALNLDNQDLLERIANEARDHNAALARATANAVSDYADRHRLRQACRGGTQEAGPATLPDDPGAPDSPDGDDVVAVPREDFEQLAQDAMRGAEARAFLIDLANEGLAKVVWPEPEFGRE